MAHAKLIAEALTSAAIGELADRVFTPDSSLRRWLDEVSQPPEGVELNAHKTYTGVFYVLRNRIRRALVLEHRSEHRPGRGSGHPPDYLRRSTIDFPRRHNFDDDDEFPGFR